MATAQTNKSIYSPRRGHSQPFIESPTKPPEIKRLSILPNQQPPVPLALVVQKIKSCFLDGNKHVSITEIQFCLAPFNSHAAYLAQGTLFTKKCTCPTKEPVTLSYPLYDPIPFPRMHPFIEPSHESIQSLQNQALKYNPQAPF
jgi:hypothetical protein